MGVVEIYLMMMLFFAVVGFVVVPTLLLAFPSLTHPDHPINRFLKRLLE